MIECIGTILKISPILLFFVFVFVLGWSFLGINDLIKEGSCERVWRLVLMAEIANKSGSMATCPCHDGWCPSWRLMCVDPIGPTVIRQMARNGRWDILKLQGSKHLIFFFQVIFFKFIDFFFFFHFTSEPFVSFNWIPKSFNTSHF